MLVAQRVVAYLTLATLALLVVAGVRRRYHRLCYTLPLYLATVFVCDLLILLWPGRFYTWGFWTLKEALYVALKLAVAIELASLVFQAFPGARATARLVLQLGLVGLVAMVFLPIPEAPVPHVPGFALAWQILPRLTNTTAILFAAVWGLTLYYNVPQHPWHLAIMRGFVPYLLVFTVALRLTAGPTTRAWTSLADTVSYLAMLLYWFSALLRPEPPPPADPQMVERLQPWRARLAR